MKIEFNNLIPYIDKLFLRYYKLHYKKFFGEEFDESLDSDLRRILPGAGGDCLHSARNLIKEFIATGDYDILPQFSDRMFGIRFIVDIKKISNDTADIKIEILDNPQNTRIRKCVSFVIKKLQREGFDVNLL